jgi:hypothetical protein
LRQIFELRGIPRVIFKGGTSLSKVFGLIKRFSEDIDLVLNRHELGFNEANDPANQEGTNLRERTIAKLKNRCVQVITEDFVPKLKAQVESVIGDGKWSLELDPNAPDGDAVEFAYEQSIPDAITPGYIKRAVRLELGCRGDQVPCEEGTVTPYAAEVYPDQFTIRDATVNVITAERTFWEKATILHREYYRAENGKPISERVFRHYDDLAVMSRTERGESAITQHLGLLEQVAAHKQHFFREGNAHYELAKKARYVSSPAPPSSKHFARTTNKCARCTSAVNPILTR